MRITVIIASIVAATLAFGAQAQSEAPADETAPEAAPAPEIRPTPEDEATTDGDAATAEIPPPSEEEARRAHLEDLFRRLADPEAKDWQRVQAQIIGAWNQSGSPSMDLLAARADRAMEKQDLDTALIHLNDLVRLAPDFAEGWNKRATVYFMKEEYGPSLEDISRTLKLEPRHFGALSGLGIILDRIGNAEGALEAYRRAVTIHPHLEGIQDGIRKLEKQVEGERL